tara:strand:+ start:2480 stop:2785 length:306 start_codon:yes stop_codon:yes gene_type:complete
MEASTTLRKNEPNTAVRLKRLELKVKLLRHILGIIQINQGSDMDIQSEIFDLLNGLENATLTEDQKKKLKEIKTEMDKAKKAFDDVGEEIESFDEQTKLKM